MTMILDIKDDHVEEWSNIFKESLEEYSILYNTVGNTLKDTFIPIDEDGEDDDVERPILITSSHIHELTEKLIEISSNKIKEKYPEDYN
jgi:hypothetical protein